MQASSQNPPQNLPREINRQRTFLALCAASSATLLCLYLHHFDWDITSQHSFVLMYRHHCAKPLLLCCLWALMESTLLILDYAFTSREPEPIQ